MPWGSEHRSAFCPGPAPSWRERAAGGCARRGRSEAMRSVVVFRPVSSGGRRRCGVSWGWGEHDGGDWCPDGFQAVILPGPPRFLLLLASWRIGSRGGGTAV
jgi:hypothetical protein